MSDVVKLQADIKETNRLLKILDEYATSEAKRLSEEIGVTKNALKNLEKRSAIWRRRWRKSNLRNSLPLNLVASGVSRITLEIGSGSRRMLSLRQ
jgi:hypothetical protein